MSDPEKFLLVKDLREFAMDNRYLSQTLKQTLTNTADWIVDSIKRKNRFDDEINTSLYNKNNEITSLKEILSKRDKEIANLKAQLEAVNKNLLEATKEIQDLKKYNFNCQEIIAASEKKNNNSSETKQDQKVTFEDFVELVDIFEMLAIVVKPKETNECQEMLDTVAAKTRNLYYKLQGVNK